MTRQLLRLVVIVLLAVVIGLSVGVALAYLAPPGTPAPTRWGL